MNSDKIKEILDKIPVGVLLILFGGYLAYDYYNFSTDPASPLIMKKNEISAVRTENEKLQVKVKAGQEFAKMLLTKPAELRRLAGELDSMKGTLSETLDMPEFMRTTLTEAKRVGLTVVSLKPAAPKIKEFYSEQPFEFAFRGVYVQLMVFLERMGNVQKIVRVDNFNMKPIGSAGSRYVELEGTVQINAYRYLASKADQLARDPVPAVSAPKTGGGP